MTGWRQFAEQVQRDNRDKRDDSPESSPIGPNVPNVPAHPSRLLRDWHSNLAALDPFTPPDGCKAWWRQAVNDSWFLYEHYCSRAVRDGWSALDLFGVHTVRPGWGGLVCRLRGARDLKMDADRAVWTHGGVRDRFCRGGGDDLRADLTLLWEVGKAMRNPGP